MSKIDLNHLSNFNVMDNFKKSGMYDVFFKIFKEKTKLTDEQVNQLIESRVSQAEDFKNNVSENIITEDVKDILKKVSEDSQKN